MKTLFSVIEQLAKQASSCQFNKFAVSSPPLMVVRHTRTLKGNPVQYRSYPRSCNLSEVSVLLFATVHFGWEGHRNIREPEDLPIVFFIQALSGERRGMRVLWFDV